MPAEPAVDGFDVPATLNGDDALFLITRHHSTYPIDDIVADPAAFTGPPPVPFTA